VLKIQWVTQSPVSRKLEIGKGLKIQVTWYDKVLVPAADKKFEGEVIGWRDSQIIVSVKEYAVLRFWKRNGVEVGNKDYSRRGFSIDVDELRHAAQGPPPGVSVTFSEDDG
jgi:hypothetical protein